MSTLITRSRSILVGVIATAMMVTLAVSSHAATSAPSTGKNSPRAQLSVGYSLLYQEADGIPKLKWLLMFKDKTEEMGIFTKELMGYYEKLAASLQELAKQFPAVRLDADTMPKIEADTRKGIGKDLAKDLAPVTGKTGKEFERKALLTFQSSLDEQRHLTEQMIELETTPALRKFLETTKSELETRYGKVSALLNEHYFTH